MLGKNCYKLTQDMQAQYDKENDIRRIKGVVKNNPIEKGK